MMDPPENRFPETRPAAPEFDASGAEFDWQRVRDTVGLVFSAYKRHPVQGIVIVAVVISLSVAAALFMPRTYHSHVVLLVQKNQVLPSIANPGRNSNEEKAPRGIQESILSHDNLAKITKQASLIQRFEEERAPILRFKDKIFGSGSKPVSEQEQLTNMVYTLEKKLGVTLDEAASTVALSAEWQSAQTAYLIATLAQKNFMDQRYAEEVTIFEEGIAILEDRVANEQKGVDTALAQLIRAKEEAMGKLFPAAAVAATGGGGPAPAATRRSDAEIDLARQLETKGAALRAAEENRKRQIAEATRALADLSTTYAPAHPLVLAQERKLEAARHDSPELVALRKEHRDLLTEVTSLASRRSPGSPRPVALPSPRRRGPVLALGADNALRVEEATPAVTLASTMLSESSRRFLELQERIKAQQLELDLARAAYKHNYAVVSPAEVARSATKPKPGLLIGGGIALSLILAIFAAALRDLTCGVFIQPWQARRLGLPLLGVVPKP